MTFGGEREDDRAEITEVFRCLHIGNCHDGFGRCFAFADHGPRVCYLPMLVLFEAEPEHCLTRAGERTDEELNPTRMEKSCARAPAAWSKWHMKSDGNIV